MRFEKVSCEQYVKDFQDDVLYSKDHEMKMSDIVSGKVSSSKFSTFTIFNEYDIYESIKIPERATKKSAGYDFFAPYDFTLCPGETIKLATGIRVLLDDDKFLMCAPRSGHGFKARIQLDNTVGIIDADYSESSNEGHIHLKLTNDSHTGKVIKVNKGEGMMQAIILPYYRVENDTTSTQRDGGFGSTTMKEDK